MPPTSPRSSDHDPVIFGVNLAGIRNAMSSRPANRLFVYPGPAAGPLAFSLAGVPASAGALTLNFALPQGPRMLSLHGTPAMLENQLNDYTAIRLTSPPASTCSRCEAKTSARPNGW